MFIKGAHFGRPFVGTEVGLGPDHIVLDGVPATPPKKGHRAHFVAKRSSISATAEHWYNYKWHFKIFSRWLLSTVVSVCYYLCTFTSDVASFMRHRSPAHICIWHEKQSYFVVNVRPSLAYMVNKAICAPAAIESHVLLSAAIFVHYAITARKTTHEAARRRAFYCVALRRRIRGLNAALATSPRRSCARPILLASAQQVLVVRRSLSKFNKNAFRCHCTN